MAGAAILNNVKMHFCCINSYVQGQILKIPTKFGEDLSNSNEMATDFWNSKWRAPPSWITWIFILDALTVTFKVRFSTFPPNLVKIGPIVMKWQLTFEIQDGDRRHLESSWICIFDATVALEVRFSTFPPNLVRIGPIVMKWQLIFEIQDGGGRHLEKIHFRLNRHYEKWTPGLLLPIKNLTFVGFSWRLRVVYSRGL